MTPRQLYAACTNQIESYPENKMHALPAGYPIGGRGFFPVCSGSFHDGSLDVEIGERPIVFVGQDWGGRDALPELLKDADADMNNRGTGSILRSFLLKADIPEEKCFFTNALFGVRDGKRSVGRSPGWKSASFVADCVKALNLQIEALEPKAIICLGRDAPGVLSKLFAPCTNWNQKFKAIDANGHAVLKIEDGPLCAILVHPSYRHLNARHRTVARYAETVLTGDAAELDILRRVSQHVAQESISFRATQPT